jgi:hypothetical protein
MGTNKLDFLRDEAKWWWTCFIIDGAAGGVSWSPWSSIVRTFGPSPSPTWSSLSTPHLHMFTSAAQLDAVIRRPHSGKCSKHTKLSNGNSAFLITWLCGISRCRRSATEVWTRFSKSDSPIPHVIEKVTLSDSVGFLRGLRFPPRVPVSCGSSGFLLHYITIRTIFSIELIMWRSVLIEVFKKEFPLSPK